MKYAFIFFLSISLLQTQPTLSAQSRDKQASEILNEVTRKTLNYKSIKLDFTYTMENPAANINESTSGVAMISGDKYQLTIAGQTIISDGETIWTIINDAQEIQVNDASDDSGVFSPTKMLTEYSNHYKSKLIPKITSFGGKNVHALELIPLEKKSYDKVNLYIDKTSMDLYIIEIYDQNGSKYTYKINRFDTHQPIDEKSFVLNKDEFPEYYLIDMR